MGNEPLLTQREVSMVIAISWLVIFALIGLAALVVVLANLEF